MASYSSGRKEAILKKMAPPHNMTVAQLGSLRNTWRFHSGPIQHVGSPVCCLILDNFVSDHASL